MGLERAYTDDGLPAYLIQHKRAKGGAEDSLELIYPGAPDFDRLWDKADEPQVREVDGGELTG